MKIASLINFIKRNNLLLLTIGILASIICVFKDTLTIDPNTAVGAGIMVYTCLWCIFTFVKWINNSGQASPKNLKFPD